MYGASSGTSSGACMGIIGGMSGAYLGHHLKACLGQSLEDISGATFIADAVFSSALYIVKAVIWWALKLILA